MAVGWRRQLASYWLVGGEQKYVERCRGVFQTFGDPVIHLGPLGSGLMAKLLNNLVFTAQITLALETFSFGERLGVDRAALAEVLASGSGGARAATILAASGFDTSALRTHALPLLRKDIDIMLDVARSKGTSTPDSVARLAQHTLTTLSEPLDTIGT